MATSEYTLVIPWARPPLTSNDQRRASWHKVRAAKLEVESMIYWLCKQQKVPELAPSTISVVWFAPNRRTRDNDALAPFLKAAKDGLVKAGVFVDDSSEWITDDHMAINTTQPTKPRIEVRITEN